ncbi:MAG: hypothetical protein LBL69_05750, partial [Zoogloeaceae bacterium]|nr:hypothetical protein [Zoogloeaceae bacterium]
LSNLPVDDLGAKGVSTAVETHGRASLRGGARCAVVPNHFSFMFLRRLVAAVGKAIIDGQQRQTNRAAGTKSRACWLE